MDTTNYSIATAMPRQLTLPAFETLLSDIPLIDRLYSWIVNRARAADWQAFRNSIRTAAAAIGCSPGAIPPLMRQLVAQGRIIVYPVSKWRYVRVALDAISSAPLIDQPEALIDQRMYMVEDIKDQEEEGRSRVFENNQPAVQPQPVEAADPRAQELAEHGVFPQAIPEILENQPGDSWNIGDFLRDVAAAARRGKGIGYVVNTWRNGRRLSSGGTHSDGDTGRSGAGTGGNVVEADRTARPGSWRDTTDPGPSCTRSYAEYLGATGVGRQRIERYRLPDGTVSEVRVGQGGTLPEVWTPIDTTFDTSSW